MKGVSLQGAKPKQQGWLSEDEVATSDESPLQVSPAFSALSLNEMATHWHSFKARRETRTDRNTRQELVSSSDALVRYFQRLFTPTHTACNATLLLLLLLLSHLPSSYFFLFPFYFLPFTLTLFYLLLLLPPLTLIPTLLTLYCYIFVLSIYTCTLFLFSSHFCRAGCSEQCLLFTSLPASFVLLQLSSPPLRVSSLCSTFANFLSLICWQRILGSLLCGTWKKRHLWTFFGSESFSRLCKYTIFYILWITHFTHLKLVWEHKEWVEVCFKKR